MAQRLKALGVSRTEYRGEGCLFHTWGRPRIYIHSLEQRPAPRNRCVKEEGAEVGLKVGSLGRREHKDC